MLRILPQPHDLLDGQGAQDGLGGGAQAVLGIEGLHQGVAQLGGHQDEQDFPLLAQLQAIGLELRCFFIPIRL